MRRFYIECQLSYFIVNISVQTPEKRYLTTFHYEINLPKKQKTKKKPWAFILRMRFVTRNFSDAVRNDSTTAH